jgi:hypothetical protein
MLTQQPHIQPDLQISLRCCTQGHGQHSQRCPPSSAPGTRPDDSTGAQLAMASSSARNSASGRTCPHRLHSSGSPPGRGATVPKHSGRGHVYLRARAGTSVPRERSQGADSHSSATWHHGQDAGCACEPCHKAPARDQLNQGALPGELSRACEPVAPEADCVGAQGRQRAVASTPAGRVWAGPRT